MKLLFIWLLCQLMPTTIEFSQINVSSNQIKYTMVVKKTCYQYTIKRYTCYAGSGQLTYIELQQFFRKKQIGKKYQGKYLFLDSRNIIVIMNWNNHEIILYGIRIRCN